MKFLDNFLFLACLFFSVLFVAEQYIFQDNSVIQEVIGLNILPILLSFLLIIKGYKGIVGRMVFLKRTGVVKDKQAVFLGKFLMICGIILLSVYLYSLLPRLSPYFSY